MSLPEPMRNEQLRVIVDREGDEFTARCVDFEIEGAGRSADAALEAFVKAWIRHVLVAHELGRSPFADIRRQDRELAERWNKIEVTAAVRPFRIPAFQIVPKESATPPSRSWEGRALIAA